MQEQVQDAQKSFRGLDEIPDAVTTSKPISPAVHGLLDYLLLVVLLVVPSVLKFPKSVVRLYRAQALILLPYAALTDQPFALKHLIPFQMHEKIDSTNVAVFTLQTFLEDFRKDQRALVFNLVFTAVTAITVFLTDWNGKMKTNDVG